jgi:hypothetical protein
MKARASALHPAFRWLRQRPRLGAVLPLAFGVVGILALLAISGCAPPTMRRAVGGSTSTMATPLGDASNAVPDDSRRSAAGTWVIAAALGDNQYENGTLAKFQRSYDPTWGRLKGRTHPAAGNHEYRTAGAAGYFDISASRPDRDRPGGTASTSAPGT